MKLKPCFCSIFVGFIALTSITAGASNALPTDTLQARQQFVETFPDRLQYVGVAVEEEDYFVWGSSPVVGPEGNIHLFVSRWPSTTGGDGWATHCEIARYVADNPEGPFKFAEVVVKSEPGQLSPSNSTIRKFGDKYALVYIANDGRKKHPQNQKIYMRIANAPTGPWKKAGETGLVLNTPADKSTWCYKSWVGVNNPSIIQHPDGRYFMYYKAGPSGGVRRFGVAISDTLEGPYTHEKKSVTPTFAKKKTIEDGYAFIHDKTFYILSRSKRAHSVFPGYDGVLWESQDGLSFKAHPGYRTAKHYFPEALKAKMNIIWRGGELERPQLLMLDGKPAYLYSPAGLNLNKTKNSVSFIYKIAPTPAQQENLSK